MEGDIDVRADVVDQPHLTKSDFSKAFKVRSALATLKKTANVGSQLDATAPVIEKRTLDTNPPDSTASPGRACQENDMVWQSSAVARPLLVTSAKVPTTAFHALTTNLARNPAEANLGASHGFANPTACDSPITSIFPRVLSTTGGDSATTTGVVAFPTTKMLTSFATVVRPSTTNPGPIGSINSAHASLRTTASTSFQTLTSTTLQTFTNPGLPTITPDQGATPSPTGLNRSVLGNNPSASQSQAIAGSVIGATSMVLLGLIVYCILRYKLRYRVVRWAFTYGSPASAVLERRLHQPRLITTAQPFLEFPAAQDRPSSKGKGINHTGSILARKDRGDIEQAVGDNELTTGDNEPAAGDIEQARDPFGDPGHAGENASNSSDENQGISNALVRLQAFTNQFEGEFQQLCALAQSGQLSPDDHLRLGEIRRTAGLTIAHGSWYDGASDAGSVLPGPPPSTTPPSYCSYSR